MESETTKQQYHALSLPLSLSLPLQLVDWSFISGCAHFSPARPGRSVSPPCKYFTTRTLSAGNAWATSVVLARVRLSRKFWFASNIARACWCCLELRLALLRGASHAFKILLITGSECVASFEEGGRRARISQFRRPFNACLSDSCTCGEVVVVGVVVVVAV